MTTDTATTEPTTGPTAFSFGDPEAVLSNNIGDYLGVFLDDKNEYYSTPVSFEGLAKLLDANAHHGTIPRFKRNMLRKSFISNAAISHTDLGNACFDLMVFGNFYLQRIFNGLGNVIRYIHIPALNVRRMKQADRYCLLQKGKDSIKFKVGEILHKKEYDPKQNIYGVPEYLGGIQSILLNESATLFRRKYFDNGSHMGFIFYTADARLSPDDEDELKKQIRESKGVGNFRSLYLNIPGGKPDSVKIIPVGDIATKDEFQRIKDVTQRDILSMWRIQPILAGVMPDNAGGFGDIEKISRIYEENEIVPMQDIFKELNSELPPHKHLKFIDKNIVA